MELSKRRERAGAEGAATVLARQDTKRFSPHGEEVTTADVLRAVELFKVLSHPDRLLITCALGDGRVTTQKQLVEEFGWPQSTAARHLAVLRNVGLVSAERHGSEVLLHLGNPVALHLMETMCAWVHDGSSDRTRPDRKDPGVLSTTTPLAATASLMDGASSEGGPENGASSS